MLDQALRLLFDTLGYHLGLEPLMLELSDAMFGNDGRPDILLKDLVPSHQYRERYEEILKSGYAWVNLSYVGNLDQTPIVTVELPHEARGIKETSVNLSGPSRAVVQANMDASVFLRLKGNSSGPGSGGHRRS
jgi:hypothetical protein